MPDPKTPPAPAIKPRVAKRAATGPANRIDANPLALVAGGLVIGAIAGAFAPRSDKERELLAPLGAKISTALAAALEAGREAGKAELDDLGISPDAARDQVKALIDNLIKAASSAGNAALSAAQAKVG